MSYCLTMLVFIALVAGSSFGEPQTMPAGQQNLAVMTFNLRCSTADDGADGWEKRKGFLVETIRRDSPDLLGTQECLAEQFEYLKAQLPDYEILGAGRDDGKRAGEYSAILFRKDRFEKLDSGTFWLSEHPEKVGEKGWDAALPRVVTWARLQDRVNKKELILLNTHFDHQGEIARVESAKLIRSWLAQNAKKLSVIITGDFNEGEGSKPYDALVSAKAPPKLIDVFRATNDRTPHENTFHAFKGDTDGRRIDWIFCSDAFTPMDAKIDHANKDGRYPSDHFPVTAVVQWK